MANRGQRPPARKSTARLAAMTHAIAIVEDEPAIRDNYAEALRKHGFAVSAYASRPEARAAFAAKLPDLVMIDVGLGDELEGGYDLCRELRARSASLPILFLTARDSELDVISGLRLGSDDYLSKGVSLPHITARIHALLRRVEALRAPATGREIGLPACGSTWPRRTSRRWNFRPRRRSWRPRCLWPRRWAS